MSNYTEIDTEEIKSKIDLFNLIGSHVQLSRNAVHDFHGQCPKCGSAHGLHVYENDGKQTFRCYGCGVIGDAIAYVMWIESLSFIEACKALDENLAAILELKPEKPIVRHSVKMQSGEWLEKVTAKLKRAQNDLFGDDARGRNYLLSRGMNPESWKVFGLGYKADVYLPGAWNSETKTASYPAQPAILIPWYRGGVLKGVRYRFLTKHSYKTIDGHESENKIKSEYGSDFEFLYGSQSLSSEDKSDRTLVITEGEFNDISVWQVAHKSGVDVLSIGSETVEALTPVAIEAVSKWGKVIAFVDKELTAKQVAGLLPSARIVSSEKGENGGKVDANDMLVAGELAGFIAAVRYQACQSDTEKDLLLSQLYSAYELGDSDNLTIEIMQIIGNDLGIDVFASVELDSQSEELTEEQPIAECQTDDDTADVVAQAEQIVVEYDSLIGAIWQAYKQGATFRFDQNGQLCVSGDIDGNLLNYLNERINANHSHFIATLHRMEYWRNRIAGKVFYAIDNNEKAEANYYAKEMGIELTWSVVELTNAVL